MFNGGYVLRIIGDVGRRINQLLDGRNANFPERIDEIDYTK